MQTATMQRCEHGEHPLTCSRCNPDLHLVTAITSGRNWSWFRDAEGNDHTGYEIVEHVSDAERSWFLERYEAASLQG